MVAFACPAKVSGGVATFHFCSACGTTVFWEFKAIPDVIAVAIGAFADGKFQAPTFSVYEERAHAWAIPTLPDMEHMD